MRRLYWVIPAIAALAAAVPARAQTYDPNYPVCLQHFGDMDDGGSIECTFTSLVQCAASASGRAAQCLTNPYYANAPRQAPTRVYRRAR